MPTIATQTDFEVLNMSSMTAVKRNKMFNLNNKDKRAWLRATFGIRFVVVRKKIKKSE